MSTQVATLERDGWVRIPGAFDRGSVGAIADRVWAFLESRRGVRRGDPTTWNIDAPWAGLKELKREPLFRSLRSTKLTAAIDRILGAANWTGPSHWGGFLVNFPNCQPAEWNIPAAGWHVDFHSTHAPDTPFGLRVFTFLDDVQPRGGGTLVVRGSHRLVERFAAEMAPEERAAGYSKLLARFNSHDPWFAELSSGDATAPDRADRFMRPTEVDGVRVEVTELCGAAGDVILSHPWILHTVAPNAGAQPRFMIGKVIYAATAADTA